jgi:hypothetical protein
MCLFGVPLLCVLADEVLSLNVVTITQFKEYVAYVSKVLNLFCVLLNDWLPILYEVSEGEY